jgi:hypothetical protein
MFSMKKTITRSAMITAAMIGIIAMPVAAQAATPQTPLQQPTVSTNSCQPSNGLPGSFTITNNTGKQLTQSTETAGPGVVVTAPQFIDPGETVTVRFNMPVGTDPATAPFAESDVADIQYSGPSQTPGVSTNRVDVRFDGTRVVHSSATGRVPAVVYDYTLYQDQKAVTQKAFADPLYPVSADFYPFIPALKVTLPAGR